MINKMDRYSIINLRNKGMSFRKIAKQLNVDRKTVSKIYREYELANENLMNYQDGSVSKEYATELIVGNQNYDSSNRSKRKLTPEIKARISDLLEFEKQKTKELGKWHKQKLSGTQIHKILKEENFDIGETTVRNYIRELKQSRETFIKQQYEFGDRLEYDFGEVSLMINNIKEKFYLAVFSAPASGFRYAYLYRKQNMEVFLDSHVRLFEMLRGSYREVVYDNMRNVVRQFLPNGEKLITQDCLNLALYYNYEINTTNIRKGNEKGSVENSVKVIRNFAFSREYKFNSYEDACLHLIVQLDALNKNSIINEESNYLNSYRPPFELGEVLIANVNKYGCITVDNNYYSVPDYLLAHNVTVKKYLDIIKIYSNNEFVCEHKKIDGSGHYQLVMSHYLKTLTSKPGALKHSLVLKQNPQLQSIYHQYFKTRSKEFIALLQKHSDEPLDTVIDILKYKGTNKNEIMTSRFDHIEDQSRSQLKKLNQFMN